MSDASKLLSVNDHSRDRAGLVYVYPVISRRAGGVSVGVNLNPNNACNWACVYCQVPDLKRGGPPPLDLALLHRELDGFLTDVLQGDFLARQVPEAARRLMDIAFSGNGEPTTALEFVDAVACVLALRDRHGLKHLPVRLISNGSQMDKTSVLRGIELLGQAGGEVWFKVDGVTPEALLQVNQTQATPEALSRRLKACASRCSTWIQSCFFNWDGQAPSAVALDAYVAWLADHRQVLAGVHLYGLARPSMQPVAGRLSPLPEAWFAALAERLNAKGLTVNVSP